MNKTLIRTRTESSDGS